MQSSEKRSFGEFHESLRIRNNMTLREFCKKVGCDPSNISRMERGLINPPQKRETLETYASSLNIEKGSADWETFFDLAAIDNGKLPDDIMSNERLVSVLPVFFRTIRGQKPSSEELLNLAEMIRKGG